MSAKQPEYKSPDKYDRMYGSLIGRADVTKGKPTTVQVYTPLIGAAQTFVVETIRSHDENDGGDTVFIQYIDDATSVRLYLPPKAVNAIIRQRDALTLKTRKRVGKQSAQARQARGELPGFMKGRKPKA